MQYEPNKIYHIYNQGNNQQQIFFEADNYIYFLKKVHKYLVPDLHFLAYCLMPNHFHFLVLTTDNACRRKYPDNPNHYLQNITYNLSILLRSYIRAINKRYNRSGGLFRAKTKAKNGIIDGFITTQNQNNSFDLKNDYHKICFDYIHHNPVKAGLCRAATDWEYSSARDYARLRDGNLCNKNVAIKLGLAT